MKPDITYDIDLPNDEELERLTRYVGGYMTDAEVELFDRQLENDQEFFYRMAPMLDAWYSPDPLPIEIETLEGLEQKEADERRRVGQSHRGGTPRWRRPFMAFATIAAAAEVLFVIAQGGSRAAPEMARMVAHALPADSLPRGQAQAPLLNDPAVGSNASHQPTPPGAIHPKMVAVAKQKPIDPAVESAVAAWAAAPLDAATTSAAAPVGAMPLSPVVPAPVYTPQIDTVTIASEGAQATSGAEAPTHSRWPSWLHWPPWRKKTIRPRELIEPRNDLTTHLWNPGDIS
jgi:hypothetical protein